MHLVQEGRLLGETELIQLFQDLLPVLSYIHSRNIIHRDISPDNIMLPTHGGKPMLIDFGVVKQLVTQTYSSQMQPGTLVGKTGYSPPEQLRMGQCYPNSDLYALAVTALVLLSGREPEELFNSYTMEWQWEKYIQIDPKLASILTKMLADTPKNRYQSAEEVLTALNGHFLRTKISPAPTYTNTPTTIQPKGSPNSLLRIALGGAVLFLGGIILTLSSPYITPLCTILTNCAGWEKQYADAVEMGNSILDKSPEAMSVVELDTSWDILKTAQAQLNHIPPRSKIHPQARQKSQEYQTVQEEIKASLQRRQEEQERKRQEQKPKPASQPICPLWGPYPPECQSESKPSQPQPLW